MTSCYMSYNGTILGGFPGRYTRHKTGIFLRSQYELTTLQNFVLRHIGRIAPRLSRDCPISRLSLTFTHGEISQNFFFAKNFASHPHRLRKSPQKFAPSRKNPQNPPKPRLSLKTRFMLHPAEIFPKNFFQKFFPKKLSLGALASKCAECYIAKNFSQNFFPKIFGIF